MRTRQVGQPPRDGGVGTGARQVGNGERLGRFAMLLVFPGLLAALVATTVWQLATGVASMGGDEADMTRGWKGFWLSAPGYALVIALTSTAVVLALRARRAGASNSRAALIVSSLGLLFALATSTRDGSEIVMTTRASTVAWMFFGIDLLVVALVLFVGLRWARRPAEPVESTASTATTGSTDNPTSTGTPT